jgi:uncharacterized membrane protein
MTTIAVLFVGAALTLLAVIFKVNKDSNNAFVNLLKTKYFFWFSVFGYIAVIMFIAYSWNNLDLQSKTINVVLLCFGLFISSFNVFMYFKNSRIEPK